MRRRGLARHAEYRLRRRAASLAEASIVGEVEALKKDIWVSIVGLYDIRHGRPTIVYFHQDLPFFRCECFDQGMFLSYYIGESLFPETLEFRTRSRPYAAYERCLDLNRRFASRVVRFAADGPSADTISDDTALSALLTSLGCSSDLNELRELVKARVERQRERLRSAGLSPDELF
jgi:hypothetical protein